MRCDRCGVFIDKPNDEVPRYQIIECYDSIGGVINVPLCPACNRALRDFIRNKIKEIQFDNYQDNLNTYSFTKDGKPNPNITITTGKSWCSGGVTET